MVGKYHLEVRSKKVRFILDIERKITILRGDSGTGKTTFYRYVSNQDIFHVTCAVDVKVISTNDSWKAVLSDNSDCIFVIDETVKCLYDKDFASVVNKSDNYFILITRKDFPGLSYSVKSIYEMYEKTMGNIEKSYITDCIRNLH